MGKEQLKIVMIFYEQSFTLRKLTACNISASKIHVRERKSHLPHRKDGEAKLLNRKVDVKRERRTAARVN